MQNFRPLAPKRCSLPHRPPLPIFKDSNAKSLDNLGSTTLYTGKLNGSSVVVDDHEAMVDLYTMVNCLCKDSNLMNSIKEKLNR